MGRTFNTLSTTRVEMFNSLKQIEISHIPYRAKFRQGKFLSGKIFITFLQQSFIRKMKI